MLLLLLPSPQNGLQRRGSLLLFAVVLLCVVPVDASLPAGRKCPLFKDCAKLGRQFCRPGSSHCGPCFFSLEENEEGQCVVRNRNHQHGKESFYPDPDAEIDYLQSVIEKQEVTEIKPPKKESKHPVTSQADHTPSALPNTQTHQPGSTAVGGRAGPVAVPAPGNDGVTVILVSLCVTLGTVAVILATVCYVKLQKESRLAEKVDYPAFGGAGVPAATANGTSMGDKTLAQSAQMYHYQHQKQQMVSIRNNKPEQKVIDNEITSDEEEVGGDFTVYECPGLAPTGEMEVKNPLFDDSTLHYPENHK